MKPSRWYRDYPLYRWIAIVVGGLIIVSLTASILSSVLIREPLSRPADWRPGDPVVCPDGYNVVMQGDSWYCRPSG